MDLTSPMVDSDDNESDPDVLDLDTDYDLPVEQDCSTTTVNHNIGSVWRDMVVGEQIEGCLTRLEVTTKTAGYTDMDDPNYTPTNGVYKRKRGFSSIKPYQKTEHLLENEECDLESKYAVKKKYSLGNDDSKKCLYKYVNKKGFIEKKDINSSNSINKCRKLPDINDSEDKTIDQFLEELCKNLHEHNQNLMLSVISKIDRKIILEKYKKTCLIEANGGQMVKDGNRRRTSGGIFFSLIKEDKSIPNSAKKDLFGSSQNEEIKKKKKREKMKRKKEKLKQMIARDKVEANTLNNLNQELETSTHTMKDEEFIMKDEEFVVKDEKLSIASISNNN